jgi:signal transduction histidine kinase/DNA-binding response OmpR family regulator
VIHFFRRSIRRKLLAIITLTTTVTLLFAFSFVIYNDVRTFRRDMVDGTVVVARVTAENTVAELAFGDREEAQKTLAHLAQTPGIVAARLYDAQGKPFAVFESRGEKTPAVAPPAGLREFAAGTLHVSQAVDYQGERYGTIAVVASTDLLKAKIRQHLVVMLTFMLMLIIASSVLAMLLGRYISRPILELAAVARDISQRHDYGTRVINDSEDEIGVLRDGLNDMLSQIERRQRERDEADQRTREKSQFLANMSHELRTPLNAIIGFSEILQERLRERVDEREEKFLENIHTSGQHLLGIVNDVLDLAKVEAGRMDVHPEEFSVEQAMEGVCHLMRGVSNRRRITLLLDVPKPLPRIQADAVKVKQVLYNLISNAVKFSTEDSTVTIRALFRAAGESVLHTDSVDILVIDSGIGIDPMNHDLIFREFQQVDAGASRQFEGTGLGLALVRKFVELHGGRVRVDSSLGHGSTFIVTLPVHFGEIAPLPPAEVAASNGHRVLVIEDDPSAFHSIERALAAAGYTALWARSGEEGIEMAVETKPSAITLDIILPGIDGWKVLKALKAAPETADTPLIIVSLIESRELAFAFGADDYLTKPLDGEALARALRRVRAGAADAPLEVLLIDQDRKFHDLVEQRLAGSGYQLTHAYGADEGMARALERAPALVIVDLAMQQMQGLNVAMRLRSDPSTALLPILALASADLSDDARRMRGDSVTFIDKCDIATAQLPSVVTSLVSRSLAGGNMRSDA